MGANSFSTLFVFLSFISLNQLERTLYCNSKLKNASFSFYRLFFYFIIFVFFLEKFLLDYIISPAFALANAASSELSSWGYFKSRKK